ncbi:hypothetical protein [Trabulsiella odontotermitis]|nr:hypothetical protein [Trabulsiella odontotermitis]
MLTSALYPDNGCLRDVDLQYQLPVITVQGIATCGKTTPGTPELV